jgi:hypothetical protein
MKELGYNSSILGRNTSLCLCNHVHIGTEAQPTSNMTNTGDMETGDLPPGIKLHSVKLIPHLTLVSRFRICGIHTSRLFVNWY